MNVKNVVIVTIFILITFITVFVYFNSGIENPAELKFENVIKPCEQNSDCESYICEEKTQAELGIGTEDFKIKVCRN